MGDHAMKTRIGEKVPFLEYDEVLVTGGTGFVGTRVCRALIARGWMPRLLVREGSEGKIPPDVRRRCRITTGDVADPESVVNAAQGTDAIVHLVGIIREFPEKGITFEKLHVAATRNVIEAAKYWKIPRLVHMSSLGARAGSPVAYFDSKGRAEEMVRSSGLDWTVFRPSVIFGEGDGFLSRVKEIVSKLPVVPVPGDGRYELQPVWVGDVARGFAEALSKPESVGRSYDVGGKERYPYDGLLDEVGLCSGRARVRKVHAPLALVRAGVRFLSRFERYPMSPDMLEMLVAGSACNPAPFRAAFGDHLVSLHEYLSCSARGSLVPLRAVAGEPRREGSERKAA
jgi:NADH dehydrogenase